MKRKLISIICSLIALISCQREPLRKLSPEHQKALADFEIMDGFEIELFAAEPLITDPVAMEVDENGDIYIVEMPGYPLDLSGSGKIKLLKDTDKDGFPDSSIVFAEGLNLPTGIQKWKNGVIVTDAPDVLYLEDSDHDGKADKKEVLLTGFALSNPQHNLNTPRFEADNWIYLGHEEVVTPFTFTKEFGDEGSEITWPQLNNKVALGKNANSKMVRFKPDTHEAEELSGATQFGHTRDAWGHRLYTSNANHLFHEVIAAGYLKNNPGLTIPYPVESIPDHGDACEVFPLTESPNHQLLTDVGVITSSCAVTWYLGGAFGNEFKNVTFIGEPVHNLVHADIIDDQGVSFKARRLLEKREFLASKDSWFRPVNFYIGPDGALYVIDYYRQLIEHPEWMSDEVNQSGALYNGKDKGRIYRITRKGSDKPDWTNDLKIADKTTEELVKSLDNENIWQRRTAQRLIFQKQDKSAIAFLRKLLENPARDETKVHALWLLSDLKGLDEKELRKALEDKEVGVKENALKLFELSPYPGLVPLVSEMVNDNNPKLAFQAINTLGRLNLLKINDRVIEKALADKWTGIALLAASPGKEIEMLSAGIRKHKGSSTPEFFSFLASVIAHKGNNTELGNLLGVMKNNNSKTGINLALADGLMKFWMYNPPPVDISEAAKQYLFDMAVTSGDAYATTAAALLKYTGLPATARHKLKEIAGMSFSNDTDADIQSNMLMILHLAHYPLKVPEMVNALHKNPSEKLAGTITGIFIESGKVDLVINNWKNLPPKTKHESISRLSSDSNHDSSAALQLLTAIENNQISKNDVEWSKTVSLMNYYDKAVRSKAREVFSVNEDRKAVLQRYIPALELKGNAVRGEKIFEKICAACHKKGGKEGNDFGPDLSSLKNRNTNSILTEIVNPNNSIADKFDYWKFDLKSKELVYGIILSENSENVTINQVGSVKSALKKSEIFKKDKMPYSAMPNGLENSISVEEMADLIAYIKK